MLDFGIEFDDSLFTEEKKQLKSSSSQAYNVKVCHREWFVGDSAVGEASTEEIHNVYKYQGDLLYHQQEYSQALESYKQCLDVLDPKNTTVWRDVQEACARCLMYTGQHQEAAQVVQQMMDMSKNLDQKTSTLNLQVDICRKFNLLGEEMKAIQNLITLHSMNPDLWLQLGDIYQKLCDLENVTSSVANASTDTVVSDSCLPSSDSRNNRNAMINTISNPSADSEDETNYNQDNIQEKYARNHFTCLLRAKHLLCINLSGAGSFARTRMQKTLNKVEAQLQKMKVSEGDRKQCTMVMQNMKCEDEIYQFDLEKLEAHQNFTKENFEKKWFSWSNESAQTREHCQ